MNNTYYIIDFDSTFTKVEGLDELANIALAGSANQEKVVGQIRSLTDQGMNGEITFSEALSRRIELLKANRSHIDKLVDFLHTQVSESFQRNEKFLREYADHILIVSGGFKEFIVPIVTSLGIKESNVYANTFVFDAEDNIIGVDQNNVLAHEKGKVKLLASLNLDGDIYAIGDGYTDYELRVSGLANRFYAFTENVEREKVTSKADHIVPSLDEFLYLNKLPRSQSYPKSRIKVLLLENVHSVAIEAFKREGFDVETHKGAMDEDELSEKIKGVSILGLRSKTNLTKKVLENADKLITVGAFCIGTNQIDLKTCTEKGIAVFNAPYSNTRSVVELAIGEMILLIRNVVTKSNQMHAGKWDKSANNSFEVRGKKLGLIGYGHIGTQLSVIGEALGMEIYFYDIVDKMPIGNAKKCRSLEEVLRVSDVVSMHIDGRKENTNVFGKREFDMMKEGVIFMNLARGHVVDVPALVEAIKSGKVAGAGVDVFPYEPKTNSEPFENELRGLPNVILTPHIGGSTEEAQEGIGLYVPERLLEYMNNGSTTGSVNFPEVQLPLLRESHRLLHIHKNVPGILAKINNIFAKHHINIIGQYLKTNETIGYVIMDISKGYTDEFVQEIRDIDETIRFRMLY
ncbi:Formate dehydrogenase, mitochondrial [Emticicia aquatica]|jgi:D-3-phosphoglycerate dehydrogenase|uniref:D-3-phosphoglycerate dehydrogenase n=1 Tax=Emticicia aquatica TaxID=1681835 RepID=A0ABN8EXN7_9BACT|nr:phosphoglycerate dehydrogenase [Emticicia aquatica]CAH0996440.1 Formate dehydrogenase, mitochondrial [Emticicia aquatica]